MSVAAGHGFRHQADERRCQSDDPVKSGDRPVNVAGGAGRRVPGIADQVRQSLPRVLGNAGADGTAKPMNLGEQQIEWPAGGHRIGQSFRQMITIGRRARQVRRNDGGPAEQMGQQAEFRGMPWSGVCRHQAPQSGAQQAGIHIQPLDVAPQPEQIVGNAAGQIAR